MILWLSWKINLKIYSPVFCMFFKKLAKRSGFLIKIEYILPKKDKNGEQIEEATLVWKCMLKLLLYLY